MLTGCRKFWETLERRSFNKAHSASGKEGRQIPGKTTLRKKNLFWSCFCSFDPPLALLLTVVEQIIMMRAGSRMKLFIA